MTRCADVLNRGALLPASSRQRRGLRAQVQLRQRSKHLTDTWELRPPMPGGRRAGRLLGSTCTVRWKLPRVSGVVRVAGVGLQGCPATVATLLLVRAV